MDFKCLLHSDGHRPLRSNATNGDGNRDRGPRRHFLRDDCIHRQHASDQLRRRAGELYWRIHTANRDADIENGLLYVAVGRDAARDTRRGRTPSPVA